jgi:hypothetical protein
MQRPWTPSKLSESLHQQLNMYALAASAAGVSVLSLSQPAESKIVYTKTNILITNDYTLDLNHDGVGDFVFRTYLTSRGSDGYLAVRPYTTKNLIWGTKGYASALKAGVKIRSDHKLQNSNTQMNVFNCPPKGCTYRGSWHDVKNRYLGLKFKINGKTHYGWARLNVQFGSNRPEATLTGYAFETIPNKAIIAGATKGADDSNIEQPDAALTNPIPDTRQPTTLGALAMGSPGLPIWRREDSVVAAP